MLDIFGIVVSAFLVIDKVNWIKFFEETFLVSYVSLEMVFVIFFLTLSGVNVDFPDRELR